MIDIEISKHALEQMALRGLSLEIVQMTLKNPKQIITEHGKKIYQSIINFEEGDYLVRIFVNTEKNPNLVITMYKTSKINKYYEG